MIRSNTSNSASLLDSELSKVPFVLLDLETTGLAPDEGDRICEIALLRIEEGREIARFEQLINPRRRIDPDAYAVNQIEDALLEHAPVFSQVLPVLLPLLHGAVIVAHNAHFDMAFLAGELQRLGLPPLRNPVLDTLSLARACLDSPRYSLRALVLNLGADPPQHRAMSDVLALRTLFEHLIDHLQRRGIRTLRELLQAQWGALPNRQGMKMPSLLIDALQEGRRIRIVYHRYDGAVVEREILPLGLSSRGSAPMLHAFCYLRNSPRTFAVDRIRLLEESSLE